MRKASGEYFMANKLISIIVPVYNEEANIENFYQELLSVTNSLPKYDFEFIFMDNCSQDNSFYILENISKSDSRIRVFSFSRNFGYQKSILTGYTKAMGDAAIEFDCDGQDPPQLLGQFIEEWESGKQIIYGIRIERQEGFIVTRLRKIFYRLINKISEQNLPHDAGDFMLIDRVVLDQLKTIKDQNPYLRGFIFGLGFKQQGIEYTRRARKRGESKFPFFRMLDLAIDGIISQSVLPLRLASYIGITASLLSIFLTITYVTMKIYFSENLPEGFTTAVVLQLFSIGLNSMFLGILGEYIARIYMQSRNMPITIIAKKIDREPVPLSRQKILDL